MVSRSRTSSSCRDDRGSSYAEGAHCDRTRDRLGRRPQRPRRRVGGHHQRSRHYRIRPTRRLRRLRRPTGGADVGSGGGVISDGGDRRCGRGRPRRADSRRRNPAIAVPRSSWCHLVWCSNRAGRARLVRQQHLCHVLSFAAVWERSLCIYTRPSAVLVGAGHDVEILVGRVILTFDDCALGGCACGRICT
jgi:hypothetical protein